ncbi:hypothetical protein [Chryseolinea soli]|uniref:Uncharacterized protein n=1 Tax=Chryseolinea soli TaxID=2321403 RepID=A0A385SS04_9BACT|nr:hypothetical protein [Chryseolinea soli]AYB32430.1 hypothetical protein D4L85_18445 [Chryseolinea soli]
MITLRQRIIKLSSWDKDLFPDFLRDTYPQTLEYEWLRFRGFSFTNTSKPWAGKVSLDKTQFKVIRISPRLFGNDRSSVIIYGKVIVINDTPWLKLTYKPFWYLPVNLLAFFLFGVFFALRIPLSAADGLFVAAIILIPVLAFCWDLRQSDKRMLKYIHESRTKVYEAVVASRGR